jgi:hypothetical protein
MALAATLGAPPTQLLTRENALVWKAPVVPAFRGARVLELVEGVEKCWRYAQEAIIKWLL